METSDRTFAVLFEDQPDTTDLRKRHIAAHLDFLDGTSAITDAGPLFADQQVSGGLWMVTSPDANAVRALVEADPFWPTGLRKSVRILEWRRVHASGKRTGFRT